MTAGKKVIVGTAFPSTGQSGQRTNSDIAVAMTATPYVASGWRGRSCMRTSIDSSIAINSRTRNKCRRSRVPSGRIQMTQHSSGVPLESTYFANEPCGFERCGFTKSGLRHRNDSA